MDFLIAILALLVGAAFCFGGWRYFLILLPIWGFLVGFNVGTDVISALFGDGPFATILSWGAGFVVAFVFAIFSYLYYYVAVAVLAGAVGYVIGSSAWGLIGNQYGLVAFIIGLGCAVVVAVVALALNVPKYLVVLLTGLGGAATILAGWFILIGKVPDGSLHWDYIGSLIKDSWFYLIVWAVLAAAGILAQVAGPTFGPDSYELDRTSYRYS
ncbi:MAG: DUF4203 domain-containing protein [Candidatus Limnocylindrales bacterium]